MFFANSAPLHSVRSATSLSILNFPSASVRAASERSCALNHQSSARSNSPCVAPCSNSDCAKLSTKGLVGLAEHQALRQLQVLGVVILRRRQAVGLAPGSLLLVGALRRKRRRSGLQLALGDLGLQVAQ
jgi:hypothetical protein